MAYIDPVYISTRHLGKSFISWHTKIYQIYTYTCIAIQYIFNVWALLRHFSISQLTNLISMPSLVSGESPYISSYLIWREKNLFAFIDWIMPVKRSIAQPSGFIAFLIYWFYDNQFRIMKCWGVKIRRDLMLDFGCDWT